MSDHLRLELHICRVSPMGVRYPVAVSCDQALVQEVGRRILERMRTMRVRDPMLRDLVVEQADALERDLCRCDGEARDDR